MRWSGGDSCKRGEKGTLHIFFLDRVGSVLFRTKSVSARQFPVGPWSRYVVEVGTWGPLATHNEFLFVLLLSLTLVKNSYIYNLIMLLDRGKPTSWKLPWKSGRDCLGEQPRRLPKQPQVLLHPTPSSLCFLNFLKLTGTPPTKHRAQNFTSLSCSLSWYVMMRSRMLKEKLHLLIFSGNTILT